MIVIHKGTFGSFAWRLARRGHDGVFHDPRSRDEEMFKFDFDNQDDLELDEDAQTEENNATRMNGSRNEMEGLTDRSEGDDEGSAGAFREFSLEDLVRHPPAY